MVERGTLPGQRVVEARSRASRRRPPTPRSARPPSTVVGPVAARREQIAWLERRPLHGMRVVVTRARAQASGLATRLRGLGAEVVELPAIRIEPRIDTDEVRRAVEALHTYALVCLTSPNGVRLLFEAMAAQGRDARALAQRDGRGDRPRHGARAASARHRGRLRPRALRRRGAGRVAGGAAARGQAGPGRPRGRGARRPARRAARARRQGRRRRLSTRRSPRSPTPTRSRPPRPPTSSRSPRPRPSRT